MGFGDVLAVGFADVCLLFFFFFLAVVGLMSVGVVGFVTNVVVVGLMSVGMVGFVTDVVVVVVVVVGGGGLPFSELGLWPCGSRGGDVRGLKVKRERVKRL